MTTYVLQNKETGEIIDPRTDDFALSPADVMPATNERDAAESWDEVFEQHSEVDLVEGFAVVAKPE